MLNISFKGYSNIISVDKAIVDGIKTSYLAMKLDDEGEKDLTKLRELRNLQGYPPNLKNDDVLTLIHIADDRFESLYLSEKPMCFGEQLRIVKDEFVPQYMSRSEYAKIEAAHLKAYTLLASLTKRMMNDKFENEDSNITRVIETINNNLKNIKIKEFNVFSMQEAFELTSLGCLKSFKFQTLAAKFNKKIAQTMAEFFR